MSLQILSLPVAQLRPSPFNPRKVFDPEALNELAASLRQVGILEPLLVRPVPAAAGEPDFEIVAGERRYRAAQLAELAEVPCLVRELDDATALEHAVLENLQRQDLQPLEEAEGFAALIERGGYTVTQLAERLGKSVRHVYGRLALRKLAPELVEAIATGRLPASAGELIIAAAGEDPTWNRASHERQRQLVEAVGLAKPEGEPLSVREIRRRLREHETAQAEQAKAAEAQREAEQKAQEEERRQLGRQDRNAERKRRREEKAKLAELHRRLTPILARLDPWEIIRRMIGQGTPIPGYCHTRIEAAFGDLLQAKAEARPKRRGQRATRRPRRETGQSPATP